ncbi:MAG: polysaccharide deacetylase family protein [Chloroflexota bacterium]|nr:polysaccharide deacetylase family protein [Chloroflexota bacterium]
MIRSRLILIIGILLISSCSAPYQSDSDQLIGEPDPNFTDTPSVTVESSTTLTATATSTPTATLIPPTFTPIPQKLTMLSSESLRKGVVPVQYIADTCHYLENRWGEGKSTPGTIVVPIMFHSVVKPGRKITNTTDISLSSFEYFMAKAKDMGFSTVTIEELIGFLNANEKIPERSMLLILDDRRPGVTEEYFMPYLEANDWTLTLAWLTTELTSDYTWDRMERLAESGRLDVQSHGHNSEYIQSYTPIEVVEKELYEPIQIIQEHFGTIPQAHIWSGGNFTEQAIDIARKAGYQVGFTAFSRGPLLFNWIPQGEIELRVKDPLMVLPRYWSTDLSVSLYHALEINKEAQLYAEAVKEEELRYLDIYCQDEEGD